MIEFRDVDSKNFEEVIRLKVKKEQEGLLESNLYSIAESKIFDYLESKAIYNDGTLVGFMLYYFQPAGLEREMGAGEGEHIIDSGGKDYIYFKRLMIDEKWQGKGFGKATLETSGQYFKKKYPTISFIELMHYADNTSGAKLYEEAGYKETGELRKTLRPNTEDEYDEERVRRCYF